MFSSFNRCQAAFTRRRMMCYTAIPGDSGIRAVRDCSRTNKPVQPAQKKATSIAPPRRYVATVPVFSGERWPMGSNWLYHEYCRRDRRTDYERGKRIAKRQHKPEWRHYEKY